jgi:hypothetical protein
MWDKQAIEDGNKRKILGEYCLGLMTQLIKNENDV